MLCAPSPPLLRNRHPTEDEDGTSKKYPEVKGDGAMASSSEPLDEYLKRYAGAVAKYTSKQAQEEQDFEIIKDRYENDRSRTRITVEGIEILHHFIGESLRCASYVQEEYHKPPRTATATAIDDSQGNGQRWNQCSLWSTFAHGAYPVRMQR